MAPGVDPMSFYAFAKDFGFPAAQIVAIYFGIFLVGRHILVPMKDRHFQFLDETNKINKTNSETMQTMASNQTAIANNQNVMITELRTIGARINCPPACCHAEVVEEEPRSGQRKRLA